MLLKCCLLHRDIVLPRHAIFSIFVTISTSWSIYVLFIVIYPTIIIFIIITINHIISLIQTSLFLEHVYQKFSLRVLLSFCLNFFQFQPGIAYKNVAYKQKKACIVSRQFFRLLTLICHNT